MSLRSTSQRFGSVAVAIHWVSAVLILLLIVSGLRADAAADAAFKAFFLRMHVPLGVTVLALTAIRIVWWLLADNKPEPVSASGFQHRVSRLVHNLFYVAIIALGVSGIGMVVLSGAGPIFFEGSAATLPDFDAYPPRRLHGLVAWAMITLLVLHAGAALYHQLIKRDGLLHRMWFGAR